MIFDFELKVEDFAALTQADARISAAVAAEGCPYCGGPLHTANYRRKPNGGAFAEAWETFSLRHSLCCGRQGCRRRVLPPSLRFLGRRVYLEVAVLLGSVVAQMGTGLRAAARQAGVTARTLGRWLWWWRETVPRLGWWAELRARLVTPGPDESSLPQSLLTHLQRIARGASLAWLAAKCLAPGTTELSEAARFVRDIVPAPSGA
jgi:hypothetical protein